MPCFGYLGNISWYFSKALALRIYRSLALFLFALSQGNSRHCEFSTAVFATFFGFLNPLTDSCILPYYLIGTPSGWAFDKSISDNLLDSGLLLKVSVDQVSVFGTWQKCVGTCNTFSISNNCYWFLSHAINESSFILTSSPFSLILILIFTFFPLSSVIF